MISFGEQVFVDTPGQVGLGDQLPPERSRIVTRTHLDYPPCGTDKVSTETFHVRSSSCLFYGFWRFVGVILSFKKLSLKCSFGPALLPTAPSSEKRQNRPPTTESLKQKERDEERNCT